MTKQIVKLDWGKKSVEIEAAAVIDDIAIHRPFTVNLDTGEVGYDTTMWTASHLPTGTKMASLIIGRSPKLADLKKWARLVQDNAPAAWGLMSTFEFGKDKLLPNEREVGTLIIQATRQAWETINGA